MRYQLRYIRAQRTRSSPGAKHDDSPPEWARTNLLIPCGAPPLRSDAARSPETTARANLRRRSPLGTGPVAQWKSARFTRGRSLVRSQPGPHHIDAGHSLFLSDSPGGVPATCQMIQQTSGIGACPARKCARRLRHDPARYARHTTRAPHATVGNRRACGVSPQSTEGSRENPMSAAQRNPRLRRRRRPMSPPF